MARWTGALYVTPNDPTTVEVMAPNTVALDVDTGVWYKGDGVTPGGVAISGPLQVTKPRVITASLLIPSNTCCYWPAGVEIAAGVVLEIGPGAVLEVG